MLWGRVCHHLFLLDASPDSHRSEKEIALSINFPMDMDTMEFQVKLIWVLCIISVTLIPLKLAVKV